MSTPSGATSQQYDLRILRSLRRITRAIALHSKQLAACSHITAPQLICLHTLIANGAMTATAISREIHVSPSTVYYASQDAASGRFFVAGTHPPPGSLN